MNDISTLHSFRCDLNTGPCEAELATPLMHQDALADTFRAAVCRDMTPVDLAGMAVFGYLYCPAARQTLPLDGTAEGHYASVTLTDACYAQPGWYSLVIQLQQDDVRHTVLKVDFAIQRTGSESLIVPGEATSLAELIARIDALEKGGGAGAPWLVGSTADITPAQVVEALQSEQDVLLTHTHAAFGTNAFTGFVISEGLAEVMTSGLISYNSILLGAILAGSIETGEWSLRTWEMAYRDLIPAFLPSPGTLTFTGAAEASYNGAGDVTINIPAGLTADDKAAIALDVLALIDASAAAQVVVDEDKNITLSGDLADGAYTLKYLNADGSTTDICTLTIAGGSSEGGETDEPVADYTNLVPASLTHTDLSTVFNGTGYMDDAYASSSSPYYGSDSETVCTGVIPITDNYVFYIKGINLAPEASALGHCRVGIAHASGANDGISPSAVNGVDEMSDYATLEALGDQYYRLTFSESYIASTFANQPYFYLSGVGKGADLIITANEPLA